MPLSVPISYGDLFEFLEDYRLNLSQLQYTVPVSEPVRVGDDVVLRVGVPVTGDIVQVAGRVMAPMAGKAGLQLDAEDGGLAQLEGFYRFVGKIVEELLVSGRFKVVGQWAEGAAPIFVAPQGATAASRTAPGARPAANSGYTDPATLGPAAQTGACNLSEIATLLMELYSSSASGVIEFKSEERRRLAYVKKGGIVQFLNDPVVEEECLGVLLARASRITREQLNESLQMMNTSGERQGQCLIEIGVLTFPQLVMSLMTQVEIVARNVLSESAGVWSWWELDDLPASIVTPPMKTPGFLFTYYKKHFATVHHDVIEAETSKVMEMYTVLSKTVNWPDMRLKKLEQRFIEILGAKSYRFREIFTVSNLGRGQTEQILLALREMGLLQIVEGEDQEQIHERWRETLSKKIYLMRDQNPFETLEAHWTSRTIQIQESYERMKAEYENYARGASLPPDVDAMRLEIIRNIETAYAALKTTAVRQETRKQFFEPMQHEFSADLLFRQGEMLMVRARWADAVENFERAIELMPSQPKYRKFREMALAQKGGGLMD